MPYCSVHTVDDAVVVVQGAFRPIVIHVLAIILIFLLWYIFIFLFS